MIYFSQWSLDNATEPPLDDYRESPQFAEFCEYVTLKLMIGRDCQDIDSQIFMIDLEIAGGGYQMAVEWVCERVTEDQFKEFLEC